MEIELKELGGIVRISAEPYYPAESDDAYFYPTTFTTPIDNPEREKYCTFKIRYDGSMGCMKGGNDGTSICHNEIETILEKQIIDEMVMFVSLVLNNNDSKNRYPKFRCHNMNNEFEWLTLQHNAKNGILFDISGSTGLEFPFVDFTLDEVDIDDLDNMESCSGFFVSLNKLNTRLFYRFLNEVIMMIAKDWGRIKISEVNKENKGCE